MIDLLDQALRTLLRRVPGLSQDSQIRFQPPDEQWRTAVANLQVDGQPAASLNVYLVEVRQNRQLRSNERRRSISDGRVVERLAPSWLECHYLISAWSPAASELVEPTVEEHALLYQVVAVLHDADPINPTRIHPAGSPQLAAWNEFADTDLPTDLLVQPNFGKLAEFWGTMGAGNRWRPVVELVVGLPVLLTEPVSSGPPVVTLQLSVGAAGGSSQRDVRVRIGGRLRHADGRAVAEPARVAVVVAADGRTLAEVGAEPATGRYVLDLPWEVVRWPQRHRLRATLPGSPDAEADVDLQALSHDLEFSG